MIPDLEIRKLTAQLRESDQPPWGRIRQLLSERGIDPKGAVLAYYAEEEPYYDLGVLVAAGGEVFQFAYDFLNKGLHQGVLAEWKDITEEAPRTPYREQVSLALTFRAKDAV